jgi:hypothetical protein
MSAKTFWLVEGRVIYAELSGRLSMRELEQLDDQIVNLLKNATAPQVHFIMDTSVLEAIPSLQELGRLRHLKSFRCGWLLTIGASRKPAIHTTFILLAQMFKVRHMELKGIDEALRYLYSVEPSLHNQPTAHDLSVF